ncbi:dephospho-CoA kinase [Bombiscardovia coagulans]|uniref:Dephospho-CoA kinase n=1 Tax=Bombiscardovia coagulans TaxID=686666 RepID=A0A261ET26_9BIFI|nr:dephospho-CoA kinase [Bombiscardovia coagulans]OZG50008.1 dephospho-CoA kinase [Bombiscardovia coagulans]
MLRVGLTGGIAAGKTTVARHLATLGAQIIDYDQIAHQLMSPTGVAVTQIQNAFGPHATDSTGGINRKWLSEEVFTDTSQRLKLNTIMHPLVYQVAAQMDESWTHSNKVVVHDIPLLADVYDTIPFHFAHILTVEAPTDIRISRMVNERHITRKQAVDRIASQAPRVRRECLSDVLIDSSVSIEQMFDNVDMIYNSLSQEAVQTHKEAMRTSK